MAWYDFFLGLPTKEPEQRGNPLENPSIGLNDPRAWAALFGATTSYSGEAVDEESALQVPAVWSAVNFIAGTIAALPLQLFKVTKDGGRELAKNDPVYRIVHDQVNADYLTSFAWRKRMMTDLLLRGRHFTFIERNGAGKATNLWPLDGSKVTVKISNGRKVYHYKTDHLEATYGAGEIIDLIWLPRPDGISHFDPLDRLRNAIGLALAAERYASTIFGNGGVPPMVMTGPQMSPAAAARAGDQVTDAIKTAWDQNKKFITLPSGHTITAIGIEPDKMQMLESRKFQLLEVARLYGLPPAFLQDLSTGTYSNTEQQDLNFVKHTLTQWLENIEQELNAKLFSDRNRQNFVEFNVDGLLRGDFETRMTGYQSAINSGILAPNEVRDMENWPKSNQDGADLLHIQGATTPLTGAAEPNQTNQQDQPMEGGDK